MEVPSSKSSKSDGARQKVVIFSAAFRPYCRSLISGFESAYPEIEVDFIDGISTELHNRYLDLCLKGEPVPDIIWSSAMDLQMSLVMQGHAQPHKSRWTKRLPEWARFDDLAFATTLEPLCTLIHRDHLPADSLAGSIQEISELIETHSSTLAGRVGVFDIEKNGLGFLAMLVARNQPDSFRRFLNALVASAPRLYASNPPMINSLVQGDIFLGINVLGAFAERAVQQHPELIIANSRSPGLGVSRVAIMTSQAPHPIAAQLFLDYLLSDKGQSMMALDALYPIFAPDAKPGCEAVNLLPLPINQGFEILMAAANREDLTRDWKSVSDAQTNSSIP